MYYNGDLVLYGSFWTDIVKWANQKAERGDQYIYLSSDFASDSFL